MEKEWKFLARREKENSFWYKRFHERNEDPDHRFLCLPLRSHVLYHGSHGGSAGTTLVPRNQKCAGGGSAAVFPDAAAGIPELDLLQPGPEGSLA